MEVGQLDKSVGFIIQARMNSTRLPGIHVVTDAELDFSNKFSCISTFTVRARYPVATSVPTVVGKLAGLVSADFPIFAR